MDASSVGGVDCPNVSSPQQAGVPSVSSAQVCVPLAAIAVKVLPDGGDACWFPLWPQQWAVPSAVRPHV